MKSRASDTYIINGKTYHIKKDPYSHPWTSFQEIADAYDARALIRRTRRTLVAFYMKFRKVAKRLPGLFNLRDRVLTPERAYVYFQAEPSDIIVGRAYVKMSDSESGAWYMTL
jgi:hypothetical protein